ncbi:variant erythrocyte surface antigen-1 family protein [Babesia caballi]|uniref:Variant erythrocyte surface antigen-1 family protein n=1 Tax=Babesia caballi TaxID=5871 RepID=A0AAV4LRL0_BABCB|nr:variant erythrocyte surface antigen-1 family protein [Babesia caballi]
MGDGQKSSLTEPPKDLKEAIDWLASIEGYGGSAFGGLGKHDKLAAALLKLDGFGEVQKTVFGDMFLQGAIKNLADGLGKGFLGYLGQGTDGFSGEGIIQQGNHYTSAYRTESGNITENDEALARVFLGAAVITFWGLSYLYWRCTTIYFGSEGSWGNVTIHASMSGLYTFMTTMGYRSEYLSGSTGSSIATRLTSDPIYSFYGLKSVRKSSSYQTFLEELEKDGPANKTNWPLTNCYLVAKKYFESAFQKTPGDATLQDIQSKFQSFKSTCKSYGELEDEIGNFMTTVLPATKPPLSTIASPIGPVAGTLSTLGLGGGAAAAYIFNLGGAKTLINGLLKIG